MLRVSRMKSLLTLSPTLPNSFAGPLSHFTGLKTFIRLRDTASISSFKNYSFSPQRSILTVGSARACHSRGFCAEARDSGEIHIVVGPMFAGKTTTLLRRMKSESSNGRRVALIKSDKDTRYGTDSVVTHDGESFPCLPLSDLASFREKLGVEAYDKLEVIGIDEAQFFKDLYDFCSKAADQDGKTIIVAGLDGDYRRRSFGSVLDIIPIADSVTKLTSCCEVCGKHASFTLRKTDDTKTELIGGADIYMPVCRKHYVSGQVVKEASKAVIGSHTRQVISSLY